MKEKDEKYSRILKYTGLFGGVQGLGILVGIVRNKLVAILLGPEGMGLAALFNSTVKLVSDSTNLGFSVSAVREISDAYENGDHERLVHSVRLIRSWCLMTAAFGMVVCLVLSPLFDSWSFSWGDHTLHFLLLSPIVGLMAVTAGEMAVLKATRQLRNLAAISVYNSFAALLLTVPLYYLWGASAIVPSLLIVALVQMLLAIAYSYRLYPLRVSFRKPLLREGMGMVVFGIVFALAGILGSGADYIVRAFFNRTDSLDAVGLYSAGYFMTMTYAGMVFSAMDSEFFPRLSSVQGVGEKLNDTVNSQIEVCLLLISPLLIIFLVGLPILLPLFYTGKFMPVLGMMQIMVIAMFLRAVNLPISYLPLAKGDSRSYLLMEGFYDVVMVLFVIGCFHLWGLTGTGFGLLLASVADSLMLISYMRWKYEYRLSVDVLKYAALQLPLLLAAFFMMFLSEGWLYWLSGLILTALSVSVSLYVFHSKTHLWESLRKKLTGKWQK